MIKKIFRSKRFTAAIFIFAVILILVGSVGGTMAVLSIESDLYESKLILDQIGVSLTENGVIKDSKGNTQNAAAVRDTTYDLIESMVKDAGDDALKIGKTYPVQLGVKNTGNIPEYIRVTIYRYWVEPEGKISDHGWFSEIGSKRTDLDPRLIDIHLCNSDIWAVDDAPSEGGERIVIFYTGNGGILDIGDEKIFADSVTVNGEITKVYAAETYEKDGIISTVYDYAYDGTGFVIDIQVDAVQTHSGDDARTSVWGHTGAE